MRNKQKDLFVLIQTVSGKRVLITSGAQGAVSVIDVSKATELGNKTWGKVEALAVHYKVPIVGRKEYEDACKKAYFSTDNAKIKKKEKIPVPTIKVGHSYDTVAKYSTNAGKGNKNKTPTSEFDQLQRMNDLLEKFNPNEVYEQVDKDLGNGVLKAPKKKYNFGNELIFQMSTEKPKKQLSTKEKKSRKRTNR